MGIGMEFRPIFGSLFDTFLNREAEYTLINDPFLQDEKASKFQTVIQNFIYVFALLLSI